MVSSPMPGISRKRPALTTLTQRINDRRISMLPDMVIATMVFLSAAAAGTAIVWNSNIAIGTVATALVTIAVFNVLPPEGWLVFPPIAGMFVGSICGAVGNLLAGKPDVFQFLPKFLRPYEPSEDDLLKAREMVRRHRQNCARDEEIKQAFFARLK